MSVYDQRTWLSRYDSGQPDQLVVDQGSALDMFAAAVRDAPDRPVIRYFDGMITVAELDALSDAFASALLELGVGRANAPEAHDPDRVAVYLQNVPQFLITLLGVWKAGCIAVMINPMNKQRELSLLLRDSGARVLVCLTGLYTAVARDVVPDTDVESVITTSELEYQTRCDSRVFNQEPAVHPVGAWDMAELLRRHAGQSPPRPRVRPEDVAVLTYTSGTTGPPKGAMNTHRNIVFNARTYREWTQLDRTDVILGVAPLFHITGLIGHAVLAMLMPAPLVLTYRFEPHVVAEAVREHRCSYTVGAITVFIALLNAPGVRADDLGTLRKIYSGGAPIPPSTTGAFEERFGHYIHNVYGLTETTSPCHAVPLHETAPVDPHSGALAVGVPVYNTVARVLDECGAEVDPGQLGELVVEGPQVVPGYWNKPEETKTALPGGALRTGDIGYMDERGWFFLVDRKKDQINAGGYKVWPREVEDVLYEHHAVREAAVIGVADEYRGETVKAFVSLRAGRSVTPQELVEFCRERMAAYKYPRQVEIQDELPKTGTGKLLRRALRA